MISEQRGVTLVELMTVIACLAILAAIALPTWIKNGWPVHRLKNATHQVISDIRLARTRAVSANQAYRLRFDPATDSYLLERDVSPGESFSWLADGVPRRFGSGGGASFSGVHIAGEEEYALIFRPTGRVTSKTITLQSATGHTMKIVCSMAGRIRVDRE